MEMPREENAEDKKNNSLSLSLSLLGDQNESFEIRRALDAGNRRFMTRNRHPSCSSAEIGRVPKENGKIALVEMINLAHTFGIL